MGERYVDVGKVRSRSGPLRSVRAPAHPARPRPPLAALAHGLRSRPPPTSRTPSPSSVVLRLEIGSRGSAGTRRWASTSPAGTLRDPRRPQDPGRPTSTDTAPRRRALGEVVRRGCRVPGGPPSGPTAPSTPPARLLPVPLPGESSPFPFRDRSRTVESMPHIQIHSRLRHRHSILQILLTALVLARPAWPSRLAWVF